MQPELYNQWRFVLRNTNAHCGRAACVIALYQAHWYQDEELGRKIPPQMSQIFILKNVTRYDGADCIMNNRWYTR
jgi:hypothetical protein